MMSKEELLHQAKKDHYKPEILEKVYYLLGLLEQLVKIPYLKDRLVLKGGTALNLFCFDHVPRLSVDIDLNYIGALDRAVMLEERVIIQKAIIDICQQNQWTLERNPHHHAGGKMTWRYDSAFGQKGTLEVDLNYMYRVPMFPVQWSSPRIDFRKQINVPVLDIHELAAGKLAALFSRTASRDLFDAHYLLTKSSLDVKKLRLAFVVYLAMSDVTIENLTVDSMRYDAIDLKNRLFPVLRQITLPRKNQEIIVWANKMLDELRSELSNLLPLQSHEINFIHQIRKHGKIEPATITDDEALIEVIQYHPGIQWAALKTASK